MKELSLLMLIIALATGIFWLCKNLAHQDLENKTYFITPHTAYFNIAWGSAFYLYYGFLTTTSSTLYYIFAILTILVCFYIIYLYTLRRFLNNRLLFILAPLFRKIVNYQCIKQTALDHKLNLPYTITKARKILGIDKSQLSNLSKINEANEKLQKLGNPLLTEIANKASDTLKSVINS